MVHYPPKPVNDVLDLKNRVRVDIQTEENSYRVHLPHLIIAKVHTEDAVLTLYGRLTKSIIGPSNLDMHAPDFSWEWSSNTSPLAICTLSFNGSISLQIEWMLYLAPSM
jgi:hypothetical protein